MKITKIIHLITGLNTGGAELALLRLLENQDQKLFDTCVICMIPIGVVGIQIAELGIPVISLDMRPGRPTIRGTIKLISIINKFQPSIIQTWLYHADLLGLFAAKICNISHVIWNIRIAELDFSQYRRLSGIVMRFCALLSRLPSAVVVNSLAGKQIHSHLGYHPKEWVYIPNGVDADRFSPDNHARQSIRDEWNIPAESFIIANVGRINPQKDHPTFLKAIAIIQGLNTNTYFVCVGEGPEPYLLELKKQAGELGISNLIWAGVRVDMPDVYNAVNLLVSSSNGEGFPNVIAEAMACEVPCVATDVGDSALLIQDTGFTVPAHDHEELAKKIIEMLVKSSHDRILMGKKARIRILMNFSVNKMVQAYLHLYNKLDT